MVEQAGLEGDVAAGQGGPKVGDGGGQGVGAETLLVGIEFDRAQSTGVAHRQPAAIGEPHREAIVPGGVPGRRIQQAVDTGLAVDDEPAAHAEMQAQDDLYLVAAAGVEQQELAAPPGGEEAAADPGPAAASAATRPRFRYQASGASTRWMRRPRAVRSARARYPSTSGSSGISPGPYQLAGPGEHRVEHRGREPAREGVLLARVVRADDRAPVARRSLDAVTESGSPAQGQDPGQGVVPELPERHQHPHGRQEGQLSLEERPAAIPLGGGGAIGRRRTAHRSGHPDAIESQSVVTTRRGWLVGKPAPVEGRRTANPRTGHR